MVQILTHTYKPIQLIKYVSTDTGFFPDYERRNTKSNATQPLFLSIFHGYQPMRITLININAKNKIQVNYLNEGCCLLI